MRRGQCGNARCRRWWSLIALFPQFTIAAPEAVLERRQCFAVGLPHLFERALHRNTTGATPPFLPVRLRGDRIAQSMPVAEESLNRWPKATFHNRVNLWQP